MNAIFAASSASGIFPQIASSVTFALEFADYRFLVGFFPVSLAWQLLQRTGTPLAIFHLSSILQQDRRAANFEPYD
jgi:hypothetical protein